MVGNFCRIILPLFYLINYGTSVPVDYCLQPLNKNDCGKKPIAVASYYKEGSRCEIEIWRGCPTFNKFPNEVSCSHHCIFRLGGTIDDQQDRTMQAFENNMEMMDYDLPDLDICGVPLNKSDCGVKETPKYTFIQDMCIKVQWKGCESSNKFDDEESCMNACGSKPIIGEELAKELEKLPANEVKDVVDLLDKAANDTTDNAAPQQLKSPIKDNTNTDPGQINTDEDTLNETTASNSEETNSTKDGVDENNATPSDSDTTVGSNTEEGNNTLAESDTEASPGIDAVTGEGGQADFISSV